MELVNKSGESIVVPTATAYLSLCRVHNNLLRLRLATVPTPFHNLWVRSLTKQNVGTVNIATPQQCCFAGRWL